MKRLTDDELAAEVEKNIDNLEILVEINEALKPRDTDFSCDLQFEVVKAIQRLRKVSKSRQPPSGEPVSKWLNSYFLARKAASPDGRPLHKYKMSDKEYAEAHVVLRGLSASGRLTEQDSRAARLFVAFCAEWFRREATTMSLRWDDLAPDVFPLVPYPTKTKLAEMGLRFWRRPLVKSQNAREFLLTLALEGGIPINVISDGGRGWLGDYLRLLMRFALAPGGEAEIVAFAVEEAHRLRPSYRRERFINLCAELVTELIRWRKVAEQGAPAGMDIVSFLDATHSQWKESLPIYIPTNDEPTARVLINGLLNEKLGSISSQGINASRYLTFFDGDWKPCLHVQASGEIRAGKLSGLSSHSRWKAVPSGELANFLPSHLALFEPPADEQQGWRVRPLIDLTKLIVGFALEASVTTNLTTSGTIFPFSWPGGDRAVADVLVFQNDDQSVGESQPSLLRLVRHGSTSLPAKSLYVLVPQHWTVTLLGEDDLGRSWPCFGGQKVLYEVLGTAYFSKPGDEPGDRFRVEAGRDERKERLEIGTKKVSGIRSSEEMDILEGPITFSIILEGRTRQIKPTELFIRSPGGIWREITGKPISEFGVIEVSWRDDTAGIQIERRRIAVVPEGASLKGSMATTLDGKVSLDGLNNWTFALSGKFTKLRSEDGHVHFAFDGRPMYRVEGALKPPVGLAIPVCVEIIGRDAAVIRADGALVEPGQTIDIAGLRGGLATSSHSTTMVMSQHLTKSNAVTLVVDGTFPLAAAKPAVEELMATMGTQDAFLDLEFLGDSRAPIRIKQYRYERAKISGGRISFAAPDGSSAVARMVMAPQQEHLLVTVDGGLFEIPSWCYGPCLVYLRDGPDIVSRPLIVDAADPGVGRAESPLVAAMAMAGFVERQVAISHALERICSAEADPADVKFLLDLVAGLNGLPASAFDVLVKLAKLPKALIRLLLNAATDAERQAVWSLQVQLPFLWLSLPTEAWKEMFMLDWSAMEQSLSALDQAVRVPLMLEHFKRECASITVIEPATSVLFNAVGLALPSGGEAALYMIVERFIRDQRMRDDDGSAVTKKRQVDPLIEKMSLSRIKLPAELSKFSVEDFDGLVAPAALAASARGIFTIDVMSEIAIRKALREHPGYISEAYHYFFNFYGA